MSLTINAENCAAWADLSSEQATALAHQLIAVGMGDLTADTITEYVARVRYIESCGKGIWIKDGGDDGFVSGWTDADLFSHVGIQANVSFEPRAAWLARNADADMRSAYYAAAVAHKAVWGFEPPTASEDTDEVSKRLATVLRRNHDLAQKALTTAAMDLARAAQIDDLESWEIEIDARAATTATNAIRQAVVDALHIRAENEEG